MIGIIGALNEEVDGLVALMTDKKYLQIGGTSFTSGSLNGKKAVIALSGVGKVNASMTASFMLAKFCDIKAIINIGVAGGIGKGMKQGDLIVSECSIQHDFTLNSSNVPLGQVPGFDFAYFRSDIYLIELSEKILKEKKLSYQKGVVASGDEFINSDTKAVYLREQFDAVACDMESAAIAHVCYKTNVKFLSIRAVSDNADNSAALDFDEWLPKAAAINIAFISDLAKDIDVDQL